MEGEYAHKMKRRAEKEERQRAREARKERRKRKADKIRKDKEEWEISRARVALHLLLRGEWRVRSHVGECVGCVVGYKNGILDEEGSLKSLTVLKVGSKLLSLSSLSQTWM